MFAVYIIQYYVFHLFYTYKNPQYNTFSHIWNDCHHGLYYLHYISEMFDILYALKWPQLSSWRCPPNLANSLTLLISPEQLCRYGLYS
jgi:hypothetical protein